MDELKWTEKDVIKRDRIRKIREAVFGWIDGNILHNGIMEEMTDHEFKLYGFYSLAGDSLYGLSYYPLKQMSEKLKMPKRDIIKARNGLVEKDLIAYQNKKFINSKKLKYHRTIVQILSLPTDKIVITRRRKKGARPVVVEKIIQGIDRTPRWQKPPTHIRDEIAKLLTKSNKNV